MPLSTFPVPISTIWKRTSPDPKLGWQLYGSVVFQTMNMCLSEVRCLARSTVANQICAGLASFTCKH